MSMDQITTDFFDKILKSIDAQTEAIKDLNITMKAFIINTQLQQENKETELIVREQISFDNLDAITILKKTPKSYIVLKNGYTCAVAFSHLKSGDTLELGWFGDLTSDIFDDRKWILKNDKNGNPNLKWKKVGSV